MIGMLIKFKEKPLKWRVVWEFGGKMTFRACNNDSL